MIHTVQIINYKQQNNESLIHCSFIAMNINTFYIVSLKYCIFNLLIPESRHSAKVTMIIARLLHVFSSFILS